MHGRLQEEVAWTRLLDRQREAENRRLRRAIDGPTVLPLTGWFAKFLVRMARLAWRRAPDGARAVREQRDAVRDVA